MSAFYTTKALGREWLPSPVRGVKKGRYGTWPPLNSAKLRQSEDVPSGLWHKRWSRTHERFALAILMLTVLWMFGDSLRRRLLQNFDLHIHHPHLHLPWVSESSTIDALNLVFPDETWSSFAYVSYATDLPNLCSSLQLFESLQRLGAKPDRILLYPGNLWNVSDISSQNTEARLLRQAGIYGAKLQAIELTMPSPPPAESAWANSFTKLLAFNQTQYRRVLALDSDSTIMQNLDHLFLLPSEVEIAMPRAYWESSNTFMMPHSPKLCSSMILLTPSEAAFNIVQWHTANRAASDYDMEIVNKLFYSSSSDSVTMILPHRGNILLTGEFRESNHSAYLGSNARWSARTALEEAHYVHFSDFPLPKPWAVQSYELLKGARPACGGEGVQNFCEEREAWDWLYRDFRERRRNVCGSEFDTWLEVESELEVTRLLGDAPTSATTVGGQATVETVVVVVS